MRYVTHTACPKAKSTLTPKSSSYFDVTVPPLFFRGVSAFVNVGLDHKISSLLPLQSEHKCDEKPSSAEFFFLGSSLVCTSRILRPWGRLERTP